MKGLSFAPFLALLVILGPARADEVCDDFPEVHTHWTFRLPACGPTFSLTENPGFLRLSTPDGATALGDFDNWTGADRAPTLERTDMGDGDWTITTRVGYDTPPAAPYYHIALFFAFGPESANDLVYWGEYTVNGTIAVERAGNQIRPTYVADPGAVSLQVEKVGEEYHFRHRNDDGTDWTEDLVDTANMMSTEPVTRVGLIVKAYGGTGAPAVVADFDYFCLDVPDQTLPAAVVPDPIPIKSPIAGLTCVRTGDGGLALEWTTCEGANADVKVSINGQLVKTVPGGTTSTTIPPPLPGGTISVVSVENGFGPALQCTLGKFISEVCDDFDSDPLAGGDWILRVPLTGNEDPSVNVDDNPGFLRFRVPSSAAAGHGFDNWLGVDNAPTLERYDMGEQDWIIETRLQWSDEFGSPAGEHHVGLVVGYGRGAPDDAYNDLTYWGEYANANTLRVERTAQAITPTLAYDGAPVSLQIEKESDTFIFRHRGDDADPWITDGSYKVQLPYPPNPAASPPADTPVTRVGLVIKTWGGGPEVVADFDYFCLRIPDRPPQASFTATPDSGSLPLTVQFDGSASFDPSGGTLTYKWTFGDGSPNGSGKTTSHVYSASGIYPVSLLVTDDESNTGSSSSEVLVSDDVSPWTVSRVGVRGLNGIGTVDRSGPSPVYCLQAGGDTILGTSDHGLFLQQSKSGDFQLTGKVTAGSFTVPAAKAGIMARLSLDQRSAYVMMGIDGADDGYNFQFRRSNNSGTIVRGGPAAPARAGLPVWLRLERQGQTFIGSYSTDGTTFVEYWREDLTNLNVGALTVGFMATSGDRAARSTFCVDFGEGSNPGKPVFHRGDADDNGELQLTDAIRVLGFLFLGGVEPACMEAADADDNGTLQLTDAIRILGFLFLGGLPPESPGPPPNDCGPDRVDSPADLGCASYTHC